MERIVVRNIVSSYGKKKVLKGVSLSAAAGECIGIVGENGCGKSTLFNILAGLKKADSGELFFDTGKSPAACVGYVPQEGSLMNELSVLDNLSLWYRDRAELRLSLKQGFLKELGVDEMCRTRVDKLSGGMKKRVSIGCALAGNPPILILDEPDAALDLMGKAEIRGYLAKYKKQGGTILIATHEESDLELCDKVYALHNGKSKEIDRTLRQEALIREIKGQS
jgi:ABC-type multidrug transport system, ATPase component